MTFRAWKMKCLNSMTFQVFLMTCTNPATWNENSRGLGSKAKVPSVGKNPLPISLLINYYSLKINFVPCHHHRVKISEVAKCESSCKRLLVIYFQFLVHCALIMKIYRKQLNSSWHMYCNYQYYFLIISFSLYFNLQLCIYFQLYSCNLH